MSRDLTAAALRMSRDRSRARFPRRQAAGTRIDKVTKTFALSVPGAPRLPKSLSIWSSTGKVGFPAMILRSYMTAVGRVLPVEDR
jgi:hypothetical protein